MFENFKFDDFQTAQPCCKDVDILSRVCIFILDPKSFPYVLGYVTRLFNILILTYFHIKLLRFRMVFGVGEVLLSWTDRLDRNNVS